ncbi:MULTISPECIES: ABC transporter substrate-binding protein [Microbacterium]|uniref:Putative binding protein YgiS n=1 Tax=Microbacterium trichothecenolyticum TaxID=69370 RepID=A0A0M2HA76_MICTR|nr:MULTISPECIES: ABC transporter substrate-binding protein [Microbacterium]KJL41554.1 putative binding protein YgiS precursor [Microbacterium trichothecenolyticum]MDR7190629.1 peptide/nickel transport system substrate-binding protein [Microbacterium sp. BE35]
MIRTRRAARRLLAAASLGVAGALVLSACSADTSSPDATAAPEWDYTVQTAAPSGDIDSFSWVSYSEPYSLDYAYAFDYADNQVLSNVCESLLRLNPDYTLTPGLAEAFEHPTPETWVYTIRDGVTFHDGTPLTAADVVASMSRHLDPEVGSSWYSVYQNVASIQQTGDRQVTVTMNQADSQFNLAMGGAAGVVESAATLADKGADYGNSSGLVNCTGPFELSEWKSGESVTLTRYDDYWDASLRAKAGEVEILFMTDANARVNALKSGEVDGGWMIPTDAISQLQSSGKGDIHFGLNTAVGSLVVSNLEGPLGDERVRRALLMAMDRQGILDAAAKGYGEVTDVLTTESVWVGAGDAALKEAFDGLEEYPYDVEAAKKLIDEAGVTGEEIVIATAPISNDFTVISQGAAAAAQSIGLTATIETVSPSAYTALFSDPSAREGIDLFYTSWYLSSPDPLEMYSVLRTGEFSNYGNWSDPEFDALVNEAVAIDDPAARSEVTAQAQRIANAQLPWLPLLQGPMTLFLGDRVTGVAPSVAFMYYPWAATIGSR